MKRRRTGRGQGNRNVELSLVHHMYLGTRTRPGTWAPLHRPALACRLSLKLGWWCRQTYGRTNQIRGREAVGRGSMGRDLHGSTRSRLLHPNSSSVGSSWAHPCHPNPDLASRFLACSRNVSEWTHTRWTLRRLANTLVADYFSLFLFFFISPSSLRIPAQPAHQSSLVQSRCFSVPSQILLHQRNGGGQMTGVVPADAPQARGLLMQDYREADWSHVMWC